MNDICERKHGGVETSRMAFEKARGNAQAQRNLIHREISTRGDLGLTSKEYAQSVSKPLHAISGRFSELQRDGWIFKTEQTRDGATVWKAII